MEKGLLLGIGNPLLDITVYGDNNLLKKYKLNADDAVLATDEQATIYADLIKNFDVHYTAGGSVQNSMRVCQWILKEPGVCVFMGSVGRDDYCKILEKTAESDGLEIKYQYQDNLPTGTCAVIVTTQGGINKRSLCASLGAAEKFTLNHFCPKENYIYVERAKFFYFSGFFLSVSPETVADLGEKVAKENKIFVANLSAPFICKLFKEQLKKMLTYTDILFGNDSEAEMFADGFFDTKNVLEIAFQIAKMPKVNKSRKRIIIFTRGPHPVLYVHDNKVCEIKVPPIPKDKIIDTNGAGDAFAGGFLSQLVKGKSIEKCIECGIWAAGHIIQRSGCTFDKNVSYPG